MDGSDVPSDFELSRITIPLALHYSSIDRFTNPQDVERLIPKLNNSHIYVQKVDDFNHVDFISGIHARSIVYSVILEFFQKNH